jgi:hypothetical protein
LPAFQEMVWAGAGEAARIAAPETQASDGAGRAKGRPVGDGADVLRMLLVLDSPDGCVLDGRHR